MKLLPSSDGVGDDSRAVSEDNEEEEEEEEQEEEEEEESSIGDLSIYRLDETQDMALSVIADDASSVVGISGSDCKGEILVAGDHVYMWCTLYQHHGIVLEATADYLLIAEFTNAALLDTPLIQSTSHASSAVSTGVTGAFRFVREKTYIYTTESPSSSSSSCQKWHKVKYRANPIECMTWRPGTCSSETPDAVDRILTRVQFLDVCRHLIPDYHVLNSNCEAVATWCMTGKYTSQQVRLLDRYSKMTLTGVGALVFPIVGVAALGGLSLWHSMQGDKQCQETTEMLNREFAVYTMGKSPFTKCWVQATYASALVAT